MKNKTLLKICEDLFEDCADLFSRFDDIEFNPTGSGARYAFSNSFYTVGEGDDFIKKHGKDKDLKALENEEMFDDLYSFSGNVAALAFSFGYAMGQMVDPTDPADRDRIKKIQRVIREKQLLPYVPKERKVASERR